LEKVELPQELSTEATKSVWLASKGSDLKTIDPKDAGARAHARMCARKVIYYSEPAKKAGRG